MAVFGSPNFYKTQFCTQARLTLAGITVIPSPEVRNLGVVFDSDLSLKAHVSQLTARCYSCLRRIKCCQRALTRITAASVVNRVIVTRLDYWNSLLPGYTIQTLDKLQRVLNCSARVIFGGDSHQHVTPYCAIIGTGCGQGNASRSNSAYWCTRQYTALHHVIWTRCAFQFRLFHNLSALRSAAHGDLVVPKTRLQLGNRPFCVAGPVAWNSLPLHIRAASTLSTFKNMLKTCSNVPTSRTNCFAEYEQRTLYGALLVTLVMLLHPYKLSFYYYLLLLSYAGNYTVSLLTFYCMMILHLHVCDASIQQ